MSAKPIVTFTKFHGYAVTGKTRLAIVDGSKGHPLIADGSKIRTSSVINVQLDAAGEPICIETANTIYQRRVG